MLGAVGLGKNAIDSSTVLAGGRMPAAPPSRCPVGSTNMQHTTAERERENHEQVSRNAPCGTSTTKLPTHESRILSKAAV